MEASRLEERAAAAERLVAATGESRFPFSHPDYPHAWWMTEARRAAAEAAFAGVPSDPFARGRAGGLLLWENAARPTPWTEFRTMSAQRVPAFRKTNATWLGETVPAFYRVGTEGEGGTVRRPATPAVVDLMSDPKGWRLLEAAHALAHRSEVRRRFRPQGYGLYGSLTVNWVARLAVARKYGIPVDVSGEPPPATAEEAARSGDGLWRYGISLCDSNSFHAPFVRVPCIGRNAPVPERDVAFLAVGVYIEPHPKGFTDGTGKWMEVNRWSCSPSMVSLGGWELADVVFRQQPNILVRGHAQPEFVIATPALMPYDTLPEYIEAAKSARGEAVADNARFWLVDEWLGSDDMRRLVASSPTLPCRDCLRLNMRAEGAPGKPQCSPPAEKPGKTAHLTREEKEWKDWDDRIDRVFDMVEKAVVYYESRLYGATEARRRRRARRHAAKERDDALRRMAALVAKAEGAVRGGKPSVAAALYAEAEALRGRLNANGVAETPTM